MNMGNSQIPKGPNYKGPGKYQHYKGGQYEVIGLAMHESQMYRLVIYKPLTAGSKLEGTEVAFWARPLDDFNEKVQVGEFDEGTWALVRRFEKLVVSPG